MKLTFFGAAKQVAGSQFLLEIEDYKVLIDCGSDLNPKNNQNPNQSFSNFDFDASTINLVVLTHAHIDHSGQIPNLYAEGFEGRVVCTAATADLAEILLYDSASLNMKKLKSIEGSKKKSKKRKIEHSKGLYTKRHVAEAVDNFYTIPYNSPFYFLDNASVTFFPAGHLLGAAHIVFNINEGEETKSIAFSGDVGRRNYPLLVDPYPIPQVDYLVCETTYGNRYHQDQIDAKERLFEIIKKACYDIPGRLIIPAFSVGRTQALLFTLNQLFEDKDLLPITVFTDSPLARSSTKIHEKYVNLLNEEAQRFYKEEDTLFDFNNLIYLNSEKEIESHTKACIIISSSGMVKGGKIEKHIASNIENPYATILMIGYSIEGTIGYELANSEPKTIQLRNEKLSVNANLIRTDVFSGHGDKDDLLNFVSSQNPEKLKGIFLVHGEVDSMIEFEKELNLRGFKNIIIPEKMQTFDL